MPGWVRMGRRGKDEGGTPSGPEARFPNVSAETELSRGETAGWSPLCF